MYGHTFFFVLYRVMVSNLCLRPGSIPSHRASTPPQVSSFVQALRKLKTPVVLNPLHSFFLIKKLFFQVQAEYSYFSADFRLEIFLYHS